MKLPRSSSLPCGEVGTEAKLLLIGIPVFIWTMLPIYHMFLLRPKEARLAGKILARSIRRLTTISISYFTSSIISCGISGGSSGNSLGDRGRRVGALTLLIATCRGVLDLAGSRSPAAAG